MAGEVLQPHGIPAVEKCSLLILKLTHLTFLKVMHIKSRFVLIRASNSFKELFFMTTVRQRSVIKSFSSLAAIRNPAEMALDKTSYKLALSNPAEGYISSLVIY